MSHTKSSRKRVAKIHERLPSGFAFANKLQTAEYDATGSVNGASKVLLVGDDLMRLAVRLRPPRRWGDVISPIARSFAFRTGFRVSNPDNDEALAWYVREYNNGWAAGHRDGVSELWHSGKTLAAWDDGFLDAVAQRPKWHNTYCTDHDSCGEA